MRVMDVFEIMKNNDKMRVDIKSLNICLNRIIENKKIETRNFEKKEEKKKEKKKNPRNDPHLIFLKLVEINEK